MENTVVPGGDEDETLLTTPSGATVTIPVVTGTEQAVPKGPPTTLGVEQTTLTHPKVSGAPGSSGVGPGTGVGSGTMTTTLDSSRLADLARRLSGGVGGPLQGLQPSQPGRDQAPKETTEPLTISERAQFEELKKKKELYTFSDSF